MDNLEKTIDALRKVLVDETGIEPRGITRDSYTWREYIKKEGDVSEACYKSKENWKSSELERLRKLNIILLDIPLLDDEKLKRYKSMFDYTMESPPMDARVGPITPDVKFLYHLTPFNPRISRGYFGELDDLMRKNGVVGNPDQEAFTFLKDRQTDILYGAFYPDDGWPNDADNHPIRFEIGIAELMNYRNIFHDSMGLTTEESDHNYVVFGGVPIKAIRAFEMLDHNTGEIVHRIDV